jgi:transcriptional regulator with XRE-family HTH domain
MAKQSTFGGYLTSIRTDNYALVSAMALKAGVSRATWQSWEADRLIPDEDELRTVCQRLELGKIATARLFELRASLARAILTRLSLHEPDQLVAAGAGVVEAEMEWRKLPAQVQELLTRWARANGKSFPEDFLRVLFELETPEDQERWIDEVLGGPDVE